ncbi:MAG: hypothetical protein IPN42_08000 [Methylococcaceae bacterium]|nr:hypothetical protein [Methylococcaceae bacterium]
MELLAANHVQPLNASPANTAIGQECKQTINNGMVVLDNELVPVWARDSKADRNILPDAPTRAYRLGSKTCIQLTHFVNARICGSSLTNLNGPTEVVYHSPENDVFPKFDYHNWLMSPYVLDDNSLIALTHSEWYDCLRFSEDSPKACSRKKNKANSWATAITSYKSNDGGASWSRIGIVERPEQFPKLFERFWTERSVAFGFSQPSNIILENKRYYAFVRYTERHLETGEKSNSGIILLSTSNPLSENWEQVTPQKTLALQPYTGSVLPGTSTWGQVTVTWNKSLRRYLILFWDYPKKRLMFTTTPSLAKPEFAEPMEVQNQTTLKIPDNEGKGLFDHNYPTAQLDPDSTSRNFETTDDNFFIFLNSCCRKNAHDRALFRVAAKVVLNNLPIGLAVKAENNMPQRLAAKDGNSLPKGLFTYKTETYYSNGNGHYCIYQPKLNKNKKTARSKKITRIDTLPLFITLDGVCSNK